MSDESIWPVRNEAQTLVRAAVSGDPGAEAQLWQQHRDALRRLITFRLDRRLAARVDASDVVQDVFFEASQRLKDYAANPAIPFHLWLRQLAQDRMIDLHRRHHALRRDVGKERRMTGRADQSSVDLAAQLADSELTPAAAVIRKELEERFLEALDHLSDEDREVIVMRHVERMGNSEVAEALNLSQPAAGMRYLRAIRRLREILDDSSRSV